MADDGMEGLMDHYSRRAMIGRIGRLGIAAAGSSLLAACSRLARPRATERAISAQIAAPAAGLETTTIRFAKNASLCFAPQYLADDLLRAKGFADIQYVDPSTTTLALVASGEADMAMSAVGVQIVRVDAADPIVILGGVHVGCYELFASSAVAR